MTTTARKWLVDSFGLYRCDFLSVLLFSAIVILAVGVFLPADLCGADKTPLVAGCARGRG